MMLFSLPLTLIYLTTSSIPHFVIINMTYLTSLTNIMHRYVIGKFDDIVKVHCTYFSGKMRGLAELSGHS